MGFQDLCFLRLLSHNQAMAPGGYSSVLIVPDSAYSLEIVNPIVYNAKEG